MHTWPGLEDTSPLRGQTVSLLLQFTSRLYTRLSGLWQDPMKMRTQISSRASRMRRSVVRPCHSMPPAVLSFARDLVHIDPDD